MVRLGAAICRYASRIELITSHLMIENKRFKIYAAYKGGGIFLEKKNHNSKDLNGSPTELRLKNTLKKVEIRGLAIRKF